MELAVAIKLASTKLVEMSTSKSAIPSSRLQCVTRSDVQTKICLILGVSYAHAKAYFLQSEKGSFSAPLKASYPQDSWMTALVFVRHGG